MTNIERLASEILKEIYPQISGSSNHLKIERDMKFIKFVTSKVIEHLSNQSEFEKYRIFYKKENHKGWLSVEPIFDLEVPFKQEKCIEVIDIQALAAKNLRIAELESELECSKKQCKEYSNEIERQQSLREDYKNALETQRDLNTAAFEKVKAKTEAVEELVAKLDDILKYHSTTFSSQLRTDLRSLLTKHAKGKV